MRSRLSWLLVVACAAPACLQPTQITVTVFTDVDCAIVNRDEMTVQVGALRAQEPRCTQGAGPRGTNRIGDVVLVPSSSPDNAFVVVAMLGVDRPTKQCDDLHPDGCIVARRALRYIAHTPLRLPLELESSCRGVSCAPTQTCSHGRCVDATIDPNTCTNGDCPDPDAGIADASVPEASVDASPCQADLNVDVKNCGRCGFDCSGGVCANGICRLVPANSTPPSLSSGACITVNKKAVYYTTGNYGGIGDVFVVPLSGGTFSYAQAGIPGGTFGIATDGSEVYVSSGGAVAPVVNSSQSIMTKLGAYAGSVATDGKTVCAAASPGNDGAVECVPGGVVLLRPNAKPMTVAVMGSTVLSTWQDGTVWKAILGGPAPLNAWTKLGSGDGLALVSPTSAFLGVPTTGEVVSFTEPTTTTSLGFVTTPRGLAYDPVTMELFVASEGSGPQTGSIWSMGAKPPRQRAQAQDAPNCIAFDADAIYWLSGSIPMKVAR